MKVMRVEKRKRSAKERIISFLYRILRAIVGFFVQTKIIRKRKVETVIVE